MSRSSDPARHRPVRRWLTERRGPAAVVVFAVLVALPITALLAGFQPISFAAFLTVVVAGICYGSAYVGTFQLLTPRLSALAGGRLRRLESVFGLLISLAVGGLATTYVTAWMGAELSRHWLVGSGTMVLVRLFDLDYGKLAQQVERTELDNERTRHRAARAELRALIARTDPHFLFNSLNSVAGLIEEDPPRAVDAVTRLARLFQFALAASSRDRITLGQELEAVTDYLEIQSLRFGDRLRFSMALPDALADALVPPLVVQPLVENAVLHGVGSRPEGARIALRAEQAGTAWLAITIEDDGPGPGGSQHRGTGTSLAELRERLALATDGRARLETAAREAGGYRASLILPADREAAA